ncbi:MAG TPA: carboxylesterase family protein [Bryobacteraceae bacterium]|nr:carboxylesterase family protein [Bryobacteraceae bacterium]
MQKASILAAFLAALFASQVNAEIRKVEVTGGRVAGAAADGVVSFKGIPFAASPVGLLRWRSPQPVEPWTGVKQAAAFAPGCMQNASFTSRFGAPPALSEDCLYLNVWTPAKTAGDKLPVMVWIYGGAFAGGMTSIPTYDGTHLAQKGVIAVSLAYRLGAFGFLADSELTRENGGTSGNFGLEDMIAGLQWVKNNIAKFGGNPSRVTIFGESAGGIAVSMLCASPAAKGLFQGAISESGGNFGPARIDNGAVEGGVNMDPLKMAEASGHQFLAKLGAADIKAARELSADKIQSAVNSGRARFWPVFDGKILPGDQYELYEASRFNDTPVLIGTNSDEGASFARPGVTKASFEKQVRDGYGKKAGAILAAYPHATDEEAMQSSRDLFRDSMFAWPTWAWALLQSQKGTGKAYVYYFDHKTPRAPHGSPHASELGYVFHNLGQRGPAPEAHDVAISDLMSTYWTNFAKNGNPNGPGLPQWPAFSESSQKVMYFDGHSGAEPAPNMTEIKAMDVYFAWRREQAKSAH